MKIYIIRHGETDANKERRMQGWLDIPLNENGRELAVKTGQGLKGVKFDKVFSSPLDRAVETAEIILRESGNDTEIVIDDRVKEIFAGDWEGQIFTNSTREHPILDPGKIEGTPNGETFASLKERTQGFLKELAEKNEYETVLISTHGCAMRAMLNMLYEDKNDFWHGGIPKNCAVNIVEASPEGMKLVEEDVIYY